MNHKFIVPEHHVLNALEGYLKIMSMIDDNSFVVETKRLLSGDFEVTTENE